MAINQASQITDGRAPKEKNQQLDGEDSGIEDQPYLDQARLPVMAIFRLLLPPLNKLAQDGRSPMRHKLQ